MINRERAIYWMSLTGLNFTPSPLTAPVDGPMGSINFNGITYELIYSSDDSGRYVTVQYLTSSYLSRDTDTIEYYVNRSRRGNAKCELYEKGYMVLSSTFKLTDKFHIEEQTLRAISEVEPMYKALKEVRDQLFIEIELYIESLGNC